MLAKLEFWVSHGTTESGDDLAPLIWTRKPTHEEVDAIYKELYSDEYESVGFVNHTTEEGIFQG